jgi:hypothetical protein
MHVIERITRTWKNLLTYQITIEDPVVLATHVEVSASCLVAGAGSQRLLGRKSSAP